MFQESAVQFDTESRIHMGIVVQDLEKAISFYQVLFNAAPTKTRPHYAKFEVSEPPVNLSLNETGGPAGPNNPIAHFGIPVKSRSAVGEVADRLTRAGLATENEENVTCCYAVQDKVWTRDPDGNKWEIYVVLDNNAATHSSSGSQCCPQIPAIMESLRRGDLAGAKNAFDKTGGMVCSCLGASAT